MANIQLKVSKQGKDVRSTNPNDFILNTAYNAFQIVQKGVQTGKTVDADPKTFTIAHNLGYVPAAFAFAKFSDGFVAGAGTGQHDGFAYIRRFYLQADTTNLYLVFYKGVSANYNVDISWFIFNSDFDPNL